MSDPDGSRRTDAASRGGDASRGPACPEAVLRDALRSVTAEEAKGGDVLRVFGLRWDVEPDLDYVTLDEAMERGWVQVTEVSEGGSVPNLKVVNRGPRTVLLLAGEILVGARQNRALNTSMMVPADRGLVVPVTCVEQGRWQYRSRAFASARVLMNSTLRRTLHRQVSTSYRTTRQPASDQASVWKEIRHKLDAVGSTSASADLHQIYVDRQERLDEIVDSIRIPEGSTGAAFAFGGHLAGATLFDRPETLQMVLPRSARAYAVDALDHAEGHDPRERYSRTWLRRLEILFPKKGESPSSKPHETEHVLCAEDVSDWVRLAARAHIERFTSTGLGSDLRIQSRSHVGAGLVVGTRPVHTELFCEESSDVD